MRLRDGEEMVGIEEKGQSYGGGSGRGCSGECHLK